MFAEVIRMTVAVRAHVRRIRLGLAAKLAICLVASTAAFFALFGYLNLRMQRRHSEELVHAGGRTHQRHHHAQHATTRCCTTTASALYNIIRDIGQRAGHQTHPHLQQGRPDQLLHRPSRSRTRWSIRPPRPATAATRKRRRSRSWRARTARASSQTLTDSACWA